MADVPDPDGLDLDQFDLILMTTCDIHGVARGRIVFRSSIQGMVRQGIGMPVGAMFSGIRCQIPHVLTEYNKSGWANGVILPDVTTLRPLTWLSRAGRKAGHMLCDILDDLRVPEASTSREVALRQVQNLSNLGYRVQVSTQVEVTVLDKGTLSPADLGENWPGVLTRLTDSLLEYGISDVTVKQGAEPGQLLIWTGVQPGISGADQVHRLRVVLRSLLAREGCDVTWMTRPLAELSGNSIRYTMRLTASDGSDALSDPNPGDGLSTVARHWLAGLLNHQAAVTSLVRPTLNCYFVPDRWKLHNSWTSNVLNQTSRLLVQMEGPDVSITDRLPSSASNPYIVLGALVAAGLDGLNNKLELAREGQISSPESGVNPTNLSEALQSLDNDHSFKNLIGSKFVQRFRLIKQEYEVEYWNRSMADNLTKDTIELGRSIYFDAL